MVYEVLIHDPNWGANILKRIYATNDLREEMTLIDPVLNLKENAAGSFKTTIPITNWFYGQLRPMAQTVVIKRDGIVLWCGRPLDMEEDFYGNQSVYFEGVLSYLNDTIQAPREYNGTVKNFLNLLLNNHNANAAVTRKIYPGVMLIDEKEISVLRYTNYETTWQCLQDKLLDSYGGYMYIRYQDNNYYLDWIKDSPHTCAQKIVFGENLRDYSRNYNWGDFATVAIPKGAMLDESPIDALYAYTTVASVNNGNIRVAPSITAIDAYGWIEKVLEYPDITDPNTLLQKAKDYILNQQFDTMMINIYALDQHILDSGIEAFDLLDTVEVISAPHGLDRLFEISEINLYLDKPEDTEYTLGKSFGTTLSESIVQNTVLINSTIQGLPTSQIIEGASKQYAQQVASTVKSEAITSSKQYTNGEISKTDTKAQGYASTAKSEAITSSKQYTNGEISKTDTKAQGYASTAKSEAITSSKQYTNGEISKTDTKAQGYASTAKSEANAYTDQKIMANNTTVLQQAKNEATALIKATGFDGYVTVKKNSAGQATELLICNNVDYTKATKVWRWNSNGLGYSSNGYNGTYKTAWTIDGKFVADFITAGTLSADRIYGGTLNLGGANNGAGKIEIADALGKFGGSFFNNTGIGAYRIDLMHAVPTGENNYFYRMSARLMDYALTIFNNPGLTPNSVEYSNVSITAMGIDEKAFSIIGSATGRTLRPFVDIGGPITVFGGLSEDIHYYFRDSMAFVNGDYVFYNSALGKEVMRVYCHTNNGVVANVNNGQFQISDNSDFYAKDRFQILHSGQSTSDIYRVHSYKNMKCHSKLYVTDNFESHGWAGFWSGVTLNGETATLNVSNSFTVLCNTESTDVYHRIRCYKPTLFNSSIQVNGLTNCARDILLYNSAVMSRRETLSFDFGLFLKSDSSGIGDLFGRKTDGSNWRDYMLMYYNNTIAPSWDTVSKAMPNGGLLVNGFIDAVGILQVARVSNNTEYQYNGYRIWCYSSGVSDIITYKTTGDSQMTIMSFKHTTTSGYWTGAAPNTTVCFPNNGGTVFFGSTADHARQINMICQNVTDGNFNKWGVRLEANISDGRPGLWFIGGTTRQNLGSNSCKIIIEGNLVVTGSKNRVVETLSFGKILMNAVETPDARFLDYGSGEIDFMRDEVVIYLEEIFSETVDLSSGYQVLVTQTSPGKIEWIEKQYDRFIVHGEAGTSFDYSISATQKDYKGIRAMPFHGKEEQNG